MTRQGIGSPKIQLVIFDLDGTLMDAYEAIVHSFNFTMRKVAAPSQSPKVICRAVGWGDRNLLKPFVPDKKLDRALRIYRRHHAQALKTGVKLLPGAKKVLRSLKVRGLKMAVASNRPTKFSKIAIKSIQIDSFFDYVLCADKLKQGKPHPEILRKILTKFSLKPSQALFVGDMTVDVETGKNANVKTVAVVTGSHQRQELARLRPYKVIEKLARLIIIVDKLNWI